MNYLKKRWVGERLSLSFGEWKSQRNRRYLNIIVQGQNSNFSSLHLSKIWRKLEKYKLNFDTDIVAIITDGASVMKKVGKIINIDQQLCFAHGVQLGVIEVLYKKFMVETAQQYDEEEIWFDESDSCRSKIFMIVKYLLIVVRTK